MDYKLFLIDILSSTDIKWMERERCLWEEALGEVMVPIRGWESVLYQAADYRLEYLLGRTMENLPAEYFIDTYGEK